MAKSKRINENWTRQENFDICFAQIFTVITKT